MDHFGYTQTAQAHRYYRNLSYFSTERGKICWQMAASKLFADTGQSSLCKIFQNFYRRLNYGIVKLQLITTPRTKAATQQKRNRYYDKLIEYKKQAVLEIRLTNNFPDAQS